MNDKELRQVLKNALDNNLPIKMIDSWDETQYKFENAQIKNGSCFLIANICGLEDEEYDINEKEIDTNQTGDIDFECNIPLKIFNPDNDLEEEISDTNFDSILESINKMDSAMDDIINPIDRNADVRNLT